MIITRKENLHYRQCSLSIMDNIMDPDIRFDERGICNYYYEYKAAESNGILTGRNAEKKLSEIIAHIKARRKNRQVDKTCRLHHDKILQVSTIIRSILILTRPFAIFHSESFPYKPGRVS